MSTNHVPVSGQWHLILDDSADDALYSVAECTLRLDLFNKKNVVLSFKAKSLGNEPHYPYGDTRAFDGVSISTDGGATWQIVQWMGSVGTAWETFLIQLDYYVIYNGRTFGPDFRIRFSEYDNASAPLDGIAFDDVVVTAEDDQRAVLEIPTRVSEGSGPHTGYVLLAFAPTNALVLTFSASPADQLVLPASVSVPAGQKTASFSFSVLDDNLVNLTRFVTVNVMAGGVTSIPSYVTIVDDDKPIVTLTVPTQLTEGVVSNDNASLSLDRAPEVQFQIFLETNPAGELDLPYSLIVPAGQTQAVFTVNALDDARIDGIVAVTLMARADGGALATNHLTTVDNEVRALSLVLPDTLQEGGAGPGTVRISGTLPTNLVVSLASSNAGALTVPANATIVTGELEATFSMIAADNALFDGSRAVTITASANTFTGANQALTIRDNEVAGYRFAAFSNLVDISRPVRITVSAADVEGNPISGFTGSVNLSLVLSGGATLPVTPAAVNLAGDVGWTGNVTIPADIALPVRLRASDANGKSGDSAPFDIMRVLNLTAADLLWDPGRNRIYASVPAGAGGTNTNRVVVIDPFRAEISGGVLTGQDPRKLALTSGGENLYVALDANGTVSRIDPATMTVGATFAVGVSPSYGTLYVDDMCTVAGQPDLLVVSQKRLSVSPRHNGVAVYDNGVPRPAKTQDHTGSNLIEPSADPGIFFGYNTESTEYGFRRLRLDAFGMTEIEVNGSLLGGFSLDIRSDGDKVFSTGGVELDGAQMRRLGTFPVSGLVCPDLAANRVYFLELQDPYYFYPYLYDKIGAYDPTTFSNIRRLTLPSAVTSPKSFTRWGTNGLAFLTDTNVVLINSSQLVPSDPPANLVVAVKAIPNPATVSVPLTYTISVSNQGPNVAQNTILGTTISDSQTMQSVVASIGTPFISSNTITIAVGNLTTGTSATLTITTLPQSAGTLTCTASATSEAIDPDFTDNTAAKVVSVGFQSAINTVSRLRLTANNLIYDPTRNQLWATIPDTVAAPLGKSIVSIDPTTGLISDPIPINAKPTARCMALSANGRYLYIGLSDSPELLRVDLSSGPTSVRIPLGLNQWGDASYAEDVEPLDGDGTSFLLTTFGDNGAAAFDGPVRRANRSGIYTVDRITRTAAAGVFVGYANPISSYPLSRLSVTAAGVSIIQNVSGVITGAREIRGAEKLVISSTGLLVNSSNLTLKANLGVSGCPCLDEPNQRAYIVNGNTLRGFDTVTSLPTESFTLPVTSTGDWADDCTRWGLDGFAILGNDGMIYVLRWSSTIPASTDSDANGFSDAWEAAHFGALNVDPAGDDDGDGIRNFLEYLFVTPPLQASPNPVRVSTSGFGNEMVIRLVFPRRAGILPRPYEYVFSSDLTQWTKVANVSETVLSAQNVEGVQIENVEALIPASNPVSGYVRLRWNPH